MSDLRLVIFDVDGTISDSQGDIVASMSRAFEKAGLPAPVRETVLGIVGLSLDVAIPRLAPGLAPTAHATMVADYKDAYLQLRTAPGAVASPLYPGIEDAIAELAADPLTVLGIATGKSMRGLIALLDGHGFGPHFVTRQTADLHPSKPDPAMLLAACAETGIAPDRAVMIGDTSFDMDMAKAAGMKAIGVTWGYHDTGALSAADLTVDDAGDLPGAVRRLLPD